MKKDKTKKDKTNEPAKIFRVNNMQRKALAEAITAIYAIRMDKARKSNEHARTAAEEHARNKLGFNVVQKKIQQLEEEKKHLENELKKLGFDSNGDVRTIWNTDTGQYIPVNSKVKGLIEGEVADTTKDLEEERDEKVAQIWLAETTQEAREIVNLKVVAK